MRSEHVSEEHDRYIEKERKSPSEMVNKELLEVYSHYNRIYLRSQEEQDYLALLRSEILKRMGNE